MHRHRPQALVRRHDEVAVPVAQEQSSPVPRPDVEPAIVDVQHEPAARPQQAMDVPEGAATRLGAGAHAERLKQPRRGVDVRAGRQLDEIGWTRSMVRRRVAFSPTICSISADGQRR